MKLASSQHHTRHQRGLTTAPWPCYFYFFRPFMAERVIRREGPGDFPEDFTADSRVLARRAPLLGVSRTGEIEDAAVRLAADAEARLVIERLPALGTGVMSGSLSLQPPLVSLPGESGFARHRTVQKPNEMGGMTCRACSLQDCGQEQAE